MESLYSVFELGSKTHLLPRGGREDVPLSSAVPVIRQLFPTFCVIPLCWRNSTWAVSMEKDRFSCCSWAYLFTPMANFVWVPSVFFSSPLLWTFCIVTWKIFCTQEILRAQNYSQCSLCQLHCNGKDCGTSQPVPSGLKQIYGGNNNSQFQYYMLQRRKPFVCTTHTTFPQCHFKICFCYCSFYLFPSDIYQFVSNSSLPKIRCPELG